MLKYLIMLISLLFAVNSHASRTISIQVLSYLSHPPFKYEDGGIIEEFIKTLNNSIPEANFSIRWITKERLKKTIHTNTKAIVPFVHPSWFKTNKLKNIFWSEKILDETDYVISSIDHPIELEDIQKIKKGQKPISFAGVEDYNYMEFEKYIQSKKVIKNNCFGVRNCIRLVMKGRSQTTIIPMFEYRQLKKSLEFKGKMYRSKSFVNIFERKALLLSLGTSMENKIINVIKSLPTNKQWLQALRKYN